MKKMCQRCLFALMMVFSASALHTGEVREVFQQQEGKKDAVRAYFRGLENKSFEDIIGLFTPDALVYSPLYGKVEAHRFYKTLFSDTKSSKITLKNVFLSADDPHCAAANFTYAWAMKDGTLNQFECVDLFEFEPNSEKIISLTIIYDTHPLRHSFEKLAKD